MNQHVSKTVKVNVPSSTIWNVLCDFSSLERYATTIESSPIVGDNKFGLGTKRLCTFTNGSSLIEEIIDYHEGNSLRIEASEFSLPLKVLQAEMKVKTVDANTSEVTWSTDFVVKWGILGLLLGFLVMRPLMKSVLTKLLNGLAYHAATGENIGTTLPPLDQLKLAIG